MTETMIPAACSRCGMPILWVRRSEYGGAGFYPPLDGATAVKRYALTPDAELHFVDTYVIHNCTPGVAEPEIVEAAQATGPLTEQTQGAETGVTTPAPPLSPRRIADLSLRVDCPLCGATAGEVCFNLYHQTRGEEIGQHWPHDTRKVTACPEQYSDDQIATMLDRDRSRLADERARAAKSLEQREARLTQNEDIVATTRCPRCKASRGVACWDLGMAHRGVKKHNSNPHWERRTVYIDKKAREKKRQWRQSPNPTDDD